MAGHELQQLGVREAVTTYGQARNSVIAESGTRQPWRSLDVARRFVREQVGDSSGLLINLGAMHTILRIAPPSIAFITDPIAAADLLRHEDFSSLTSDHPTYQAFKPYVGRFIVFKYGRDEWLEDRRPAAIPFSQQEMDREKSQEISRDAVDSALGLVTDGKLPRNWIKYVTSYQVVKHVTGHEFYPAILSGAVNAHSAYTGNTIREILIGMTSKPIGKFISYPVLRKYHRLKHEISNATPAGIAGKVLDNLPEARRDAADVTASLIGGLSTLRSFMENTLYVLAKNPQLQEEALHDPALLRRIIQETARLYPAAPYILRGTTRDLQLGGTRVPKDSLMVFSIFAYGTGPEIADSAKFDPNREGLEAMFNTQQGAANVFSSGPRACLGRYVATEVLETTVGALLEKFQIACLNDPILMIGKGIGTSFDRPVQFRLADRITHRQISATSN